MPLSYFGVKWLHTTTSFTSCLDVHRPRCLWHNSLQRDHSSRQPSNMSTAYAPPPETAYLMNTPFNMPTNDGDVWAVAFSTSSSQFLNGAIAVVFTLIFPCQCLLSLFIHIPHSLT